ncbi:Cell division control protein 2-like C [Forsythia ovata]|uniref:Cell division control protein 2-like C n=1 Tax=Forsythia ovata TaxID=205694 RepID=A0ABD1VFB7_9LAMI
MANFTTTTALELKPPLAKRSQSHVPSMSAYCQSMLSEEGCWGLGTLNEMQWPEVRSLQNWHVYLQWEPQNLARGVTSLRPDDIDLLSIVTCVQDFLSLSFY